MLSPPYVHIFHRCLFFGQPRSQTSPANVPELKQDVLKTNQVKSGNDIEKGCWWVVVAQEFQAAWPQFLDPTLTATPTIYMYNYTSIYTVYTTTTAQSGGGSFQKKKHIGENDCCESRMGERRHWWIDRWLRSPLFLSLSFSFSVYLSTYLWIYLAI